jgi:hypothetical protein
METAALLRPPPLLIYLAFASVIGFFGSLSLDARTFEFDLVPFYCGGDAVAHGEDPYRVEPLRLCEHVVSDAFAFAPQYVVPDPLPAYDQAVFAVISHMPFAFVRLGWPILEISAFVLTAILLAPIVRTDAATVASALFVADLWCSGLLGQLEPFAILGLVVAARGLEKKRPWLACVGLALAMIEPQLGLPAVLAVAVWGERGFRWSAVCAVALLGLLSLSLPLGVTIEYLSRVLPAHALSEINNQDQYGTVYIIHRLGLPEGVAVRMATVFFVLSLVAAVLLSRLLARRSGPAAIPLVATAFTLIGAPFGHLPQIAAAIPAAVLIAVEKRSRLAGAAVALLSVPWLDFANTLRVLPVAAVGFYISARVFCRARPFICAAILGIAMLALVVATYAATLHATGDIIRFVQVRANDFPEASWKAIVDAQQHRYRWLADLAKIPTQIGLIALAIAIVRQAFAVRVATTSS